MYNVAMRKSTSAFTLVELLIAIVVIAILAAISVVAFNGIQERARDANRQSDISTIAKALDLYYVEHGQYPAITQTGAGLTPGVANSHPAYMNTWNELVDAVSPYASSLPVDPLNGDSSGTRRVYTYQPMSTTAGPIRCAYGTVPANQAYIIGYRLESSTQSHQYSGTNCKGGAQANRPPFQVANPPANSSFYIKVNQ